MAHAESTASTCVRPVLVNGDHVVIRWIFRFVWRDGSCTHREEPAGQRWEGERIARKPSATRRSGCRAGAAKAVAAYWVSSVSRMMPVATAART